jgi:hypothetical protein
MANPTVCRVKFLLVGFLILCAALPAGSGCSSGGMDPNCKAGEIRDCRCTGGGYGIQQCMSAGSDYAWGKCYDCIGGKDAGVEDSGVVDPCSVQGVVGSPCSANTDCAGLSDPFCLSNAMCSLITQYAPNCDIPGGYCTMYTQNMETTLNCGKGAIAFNGTSIDPRAEVKACLKCCRTDSDCRMLEGYYCEPMVGGGCLPAFVKEIKADAGYSPLH